MPGLVAIVAVRSRRWAAVATLGALSACGGGGGGGGGGEGTSAGGVAVAPAPTPSPTPTPAATGQSPSQIGQWRELILNADGSIRRIEVMRYPGQARDTVQLAIQAIRNAAPFGDVSKLPKPWRFNETFLFNDARKFKPMTLDRR